MLQCIDEEEEESKTLKVDSTGRGNECYRFWNEQCEEASKLMSLPIETNSQGIPLLSSSTFSESVDVKSWFSIQTTSATLHNSTTTASVLSFMFSLPETPMKKTTTSSRKKSKPSPPDQVIQQTEEHEYQEEEDQVMDEAVQEEDEEDDQDIFVVASVGPAEGMATKAQELEDEEHKDQVMEEAAVQEEDEDNQDIFEAVRKEKASARFAKCKATKAHNKEMLEERTKEEGVRQRAWKFRLKPSAELRKKLLSWCGHSRFVYNKTVEMNAVSYKAFKKAKTMQDEKHEENLNKHKEECEKIKAIRKEQKREKVVQTPLPKKPNRPPLGPIEEEMVTKRNMMKLLGEDSKWEFLRNTPRYVKEGAVEDFVAARQAAKTNKERGNIEKFFLKFRSRKRSKTDSIKLRSTSVRFVDMTGASRDDQKRYGKFLAVNIYTESTGEPIKIKGLNKKKRERLMEILGGNDMHPHHDSRLIRTRDDQFWLCAVLDAPERPFQHRFDRDNKLAASDPGVRAFHSIYHPCENMDGCVVHQIGHRKEMTNRRGTVRSRDKSCTEQHTKSRKQETKSRKQKTTVSVMDHCQRIGEAIDANQCRISFLTKQRNNNLKYNKQCAEYNQQLQRCKRQDWFDNKPITQELATPRPRPPLPPSLSPKPPPKKRSKISVQGTDNQGTDKKQSIDPRREKRGEPRKKKQQQQEQRNWHKIKWLRNKNLKLYRRIANMVDDVHWKSIRFICNRYDQFLLPKFGAKEMSAKTSSQGKKRIIGTKTVRKMLQWAHGRFLQRLQWKAPFLGTTLAVLDSEAYTSKTCSNCGHLHQQLNSKEHFHCPHCSFQTGRDLNSAKNMILRSASRSPTSSSSSTTLLLTVDHLYNKQHFPGYIH